MVAKQLVINSTSYETRVALIEGGQVSEYYIERSRDRGIVGGIYKGKIIRVLPGMQSCFVDIGLERAAFLYGGDIKPEGSYDLPESFDEEGKPVHQNHSEEDETSENNSNKNFQKNYRISDLVKN